jgi:hypothetical protein
MTAPPTMWRLRLLFGAIWTSCPEVSAIFSGLPWFTLEIQGLDARWTQNVGMAGEILSLDCSANPQIVLLTRIVFVRRS